MTIASDLNLASFNEKLIARHFDKALIRVINHLVKHFRFDYHQAEDIAAKSLTYAARYYLHVNPSVTLTAEGLVRQAIWAARNQAKDILRHQKRHPESLTLDNNAPEKESLPGKSPKLVQKSMDDWRTQTYDQEWHVLATRAFKHLDEMFNLLNLSTLKREVFKAIYLKNQPVEEVCRRHGIKPNYAYGIVFHVKSGLSKIGPAFLKAA